MKTINLTADESRQWDDPGPAGEAFRKKVRARAKAMGAQVEIYSADGITLDSIEPKDA